MPRVEVPADALVALFAELTGVMFCAKDADGRYTEVNDAFVRRTNRRDRSGVVGRRAPELFVPALAERYEEQDRRVLAEGRVLRHELELIRREGGVPGWYLTTKVPVVAHGVAVGVVSVSEDLRSADETDPGMPALSRVVDLVARRLDDPPRVEELAATAGLSTSALERRMRAVFGLAPTQFVLRARIDRARSLLTTTDLPLAGIALACGFYDQPAFTRQFARLAGETPGQFRRRARPVGPHDVGGG
ncbi:helix-turn-helix domain-containing protein [Actinomycetospora termitidis]|uniref:Helix-turn-helix domain-containing protein n=1 Tax=Actinomycetospora termitidis TaxID=3053470 RepID=A0ABT7MBN5_9PSEU|nr:helix-turn-helix domain-containing protein [Actinomycetospora sp. Odt1-22]MDL5157247.1 helix-turn-helix domain-containing protein [Actinomycetospora sp. Odt1-22]